MADHNLQASAPNQALYGTDTYGSGTYDTPGIVTTSEVSQPAFHKNLQAANTNLYGSARYNDDIYGESRRIFTRTEVSSPAIGQVLLADDAISQSEFSSPVIAQYQTILADDTITQQPSEVTTAAFSELNIFTAVSVETSTSEVNIPSVDENNILDPAGAMSSTTLTVPVIRQYQTILADDLSSVTEITEPVITQLHPFNSVSLVSDTEITVPVFSELNIFTNIPNQHISTTEVTVPGFAQVETLEAPDLNSVTEVTNPVFTRIDYQFIPDDIETVSEAPTVGVSESNALGATPVSTPTSVVSSPDVDELNILDATDLSSSTTLTVAGVSEHNIFLANSAEAPSLITEPVIKQLEVLSSSSVESDTDAQTVTAVIKVNFISVETKSDPEVSAPVIRQAQEILVVSTESTPEVTTNNINQSQTLEAVDTSSVVSLAPRPVVIDLKPIEQNTTRTLLVPSESRITIVGRAA